MLRQVHFLQELYTILLDFASSLDMEVNLVLLNEILKFDFLVSDNTNNLPKGLERLYIDNFGERCFEFLKNRENVEKFLPEFSDTPAKKYTTRFILKHSDLMLPMRLWLRMKILL